MMELSEQLKAKLKELPKEPGVYFHKDANGKIIYIGKAANLKNRVGSYFQQSRHRDFKTKILVGEIVMTDWIVVDSEVEALFLESEMIKRYMPKFNIDLRDDKHWIYIKIPMKHTWPVVSFVRRPMDDQAEYFGPYTSSDAVRKAMRQLRKVFPYVTHSVHPMPKRACLHYHLGLCPGPETGSLDSGVYKRSLRRLMMYLHGERTKLVDQIEKEMKKAAKVKDYELAAERRDQLNNLRSLAKQMIFSDKEMFDLRLDQALVGLADRLELKGLPRRIEAYDISHLQGSDNVASMVVFTDGVPNKEEYRRFKMRLPGNDDFAHMREVVRRRFSGKNWERWPKPDLILIDGGKGQLGAALGVLDEFGIDIPTIGLAKREEEIIRRTQGSGRIQSERAGDQAWVETHTAFEIIRLPFDSHILQLLQRVRDEAHRFAVTYHGLLRGKRQTSSILDDVPGVGPSTRKKLIKAFGSVAGVKAASLEEITELIGESRAKSLSEHLQA
jgi:excinuclease ABC subunit C